MSESGIAPLVRSVLNWLRAGYPNGIPPKDYIPLVALLHSSLNREDIEQVLDHLTREHALPVSAEDIEDAITRVTSEPPQAEDVHQVASRLAQVGWPLVGFRDFDQTPARHTA